MATHNADNERIKRRYFVFLKEAKRQSEDSVDAVAKALARFEAATRYRDFKAAYFSDRGRLEQADRGRRNDVAAEALG